MSIHAILWSICPLTVQGNEYYCCLRHEQFHYFVLRVQRTRLLVLQTPLHRIRREIPIVECTIQYILGCQDKRKEACADSCDGEMRKLWLHNNDQLKLFPLASVEYLEPFVLLVHGASLFLLGYFAKCRVFSNSILKDSISFRGARQKPSRLRQKPSRLR